MLTLLSFRGQEVKASKAKHPSKKGASSPEKSTLVGLEVVQLYHPQLHSFVNVLEDGRLSSITSGSYNSCKSPYFVSLSRYFRAF